MNIKTGFNRSLTPNINEWMAYMKLYAQKDPVGDYRFTMEKRDEIMTDVMHLEGILEDAAMLYFINHRVFGAENLSPDEQQALVIDFKGRLSNPYMKEYPVQVR